MSKLNPLAIARTATELITASGAGAVVGNTIRMSTPVDAKPIARVSLVIGGWALSSLVGKAASTHAVGQFDETVKQFQALKAAVRPGTN